MKYVKKDKKVSKQFCPVRQTKHVSTKHTMEKNMTAEDFQLLGTAMLQKPELKVREIKNVKHRLYEVCRNKTNPLT